MPLLVLPFIIIILSIFSLLRNRSTRSYQEKQDQFWEKEQRANLTRKKDISNLDYIQIPLDTFPIGQSDDPELAALEEDLSDLSSCQILNLSGISNTDLKLQYGAANLTVLSECDANYTLLAKTILAYGKRLSELGYTQEAITVLEFGIACKTDVSTNYTLLASLYHDVGEEAKIAALSEAVRDTDLLLKDSILQKLAQY